MASLQTETYLRNYIRTNVENGVWKFSLKIATNVLDWLITLAVGYEVEKITSDERKNVWTFVEFFGIVMLCIWIWIIKCCCLNRFCITCCINCVRGKQQEDMENGQESEATEKVGIVKNILSKMHMVLNRLAIGAIGFEVRKQLFKFKPLTTWDYVEISIVILFCIWILSIKYCILKCHCLICCCWCIKGCCFRKEEEVELKVIQTQAPTESVNVDNVDVQGDNLDENRVSKEKVEKQEDQNGRI